MLDFANARRFRELAFVTTAALGLFGVGECDAAVIDYNGSNTIDTSTNLLWLDMSYTVNKSYNYVVSQLGSGGLYEGYRYATSSEIQTLWNNAGISSIPYMGTGNSDITGIELLHSLLGVTWTYLDIDNYIYAKDDLLTLSLLQLKPGTTIGTGNQIVSLAWFSQGPDESGIDSASYLVRAAPISAVAIPAALPLLGSGLGALGLIGWRRKRKAAQKAA